MAKPLLTNHTNLHQHASGSPLITLQTTKESSQCNTSSLASDHHHLPSRLIFTPALAVASFQTKRANPAAAAVVNSQDSTPQQLGCVVVKSAASNNKQKHSTNSTPVIVNTNHRSSLSQQQAKRLSTDATAGAAASCSKQSKPLSNHSSSSVINRSVAAIGATGATVVATTTTTPAPAAAGGVGGGGCSSGGGGENVTARLLDMGKRLLDAAREGQTDHVRQLVVGSGAPFTSDWLGTTALHLAAQYGHAEIADILLRGGVNRDARTKLERTALHLAAQSGSLPVVESLLIHGSDINARDMLKMTPLHWAVERRHPDIVRRLLVGGADISMRSKFQLTPPDIAQNSGYYEILDLFKNWTDKDTDSDIGIYNDNNHLHQAPNSTNNNNNAKFYESHDIFNDVNYQLMAMAETGTASRGTSMLDIEDEPCIDLVELEWNSLKFETDFSHPAGHNIININESNHQKPCQLECLMKMVEELQKENEQLRRRLEQATSQSDGTRR